MKKYEYGYIQIDDEANHSEHPSRLSKVLSQCNCIIYIFTCCFYNQVAGVIRNNKRKKGKNDSKKNTTLLEGPGHCHNTCASHSIPAAKYCCKRTVLSTVHSSPEVQRYFQELVSNAGLTDLICFQCVVVLNPIVIGRANLGGVEGVPHFWSKEMKTK